MIRRSIAGLVLLPSLLVACDDGPTGPDGSDFMHMSAEILGGTPIVWTENGHAYDAIAAPGGITWIEARDDAAAMELDGCSGYLGTITSQAENDFVVANLSEALPPGQRGYWIGGWQPPGSAEPDGGWTWITGEPFEFTNWNSPAEPNDWRRTYPETGEEAIHLWDNGAGKWNDLASLELTPGYIVEYDGLCAADITDILIGVRPGDGDGPRPINPRSWGVVTVVVYSTAVAAGEASDFDASDIDVETVTLGDGQDPDAPVARRMNDTPMARSRDVDEDGDEDMVFQFRIRELVENGDLDPGTTELVLTGQTLDDQTFQGSGEIRLVP